MRIVSTTPEITFDDVLLLTGCATYPMHRDGDMTDLRSRVSRRLTLDLPVLSAPMPGISGSEMAIALGRAGALGVLHLYQSRPEQIDEVKRVKDRGLPVGVAIMDETERGFDHVGALLEAGADLVSLESYQPHNEPTLAFIRRLRAGYPDIDLSVGVVITPEACTALIDAGVDSLRVGIGGGSHCTTRLDTGVGRPQLSAVMACAEVTRARGIPLISDTGIRHPGDVVKALVFGADGVMIGGMFAGTAECPGNVIERDGKRFKESWGMATRDAISTEHGEGLSDTPYDQIFEEGIGALIPYKGSVDRLTGRIDAGVRRAMWYVGTRTVDELRDKAEVVIVSGSTLAENRPRI